MNQRTDNTRKEQIITPLELKNNILKKFTCSLLTFKATKLSKKHE